MPGGNQLARVAHRTTTRTDLPPAERNDRWGTPRLILDAVSIGQGLPLFDLDPCGMPGHITARRIYLLEYGDDGLRDPWFGRVWLNPPYGRAMRQWVEKLVQHGSGTALIPVATGTKLWMDVVWPEATAIHFWRHRIKFLRRDGQEDDLVSPAASALVAFGDLDADALAGSNLPGVLLDFRSPTTTGR